MTDTDAAPVDRKKVRAFARHLFGVYTHGALSYMIDIGHRTGLFTAASEGPATSSELAARAGCDERYVREWLGAMVTAEIMTFSADDDRYALPPEHAAALTGGGSKNMGPMAAMVTLMGRNLDGVERAFREGGGVPYPAFAPEFTGVMDELNRRPLDELLVDAWLPLVPGFAEALTSGIRVADVGCGTGHALALLAAAFPASTFVGYDLSEDALRAARAETAELDNVTFEVADAAAFSPASPFDAVVAIDAVHDQADPAGMLRSIHDALVPGGRFVMVDMAAHSGVADNVGNPFAPWIYAISTLHCMTVSLAAGGAGLGAAWGQETARAMLADAGFGDVETHPAPGQALNLIYVTSRPG
ncbi:class I SAM-dependent methyltransferase [Pseudonocardia endophytica]|uniref:Ubiquinone/menaquinone biosynthesis C-methylase UbiE n=1 Tax=Pseudonocardia endophytica TaxID=401976 RepID=A0A4R1HQ77_PSEEN|nr:class I SAM-dependent methyltransferase [Pseudonocardia endophytica]TCK22855.1 ubiquinone/menaquinone biosynthesis C-methylase UbiE [Pseudonocardia endophytica]